MGLSKTIARNFVFPLALVLRADQYLIKKTNTSCCILNFHGVRKNNNEVFNNRHLPVSEFEKMIVYLKKNYDIVSLKEMFEIHRSKRKVNRKTVALTFDDGYANNFDIALPVLKKYKVPATFYIISKSLVQDNYVSWPDALDLVKKNCKEDILLNGYRFRYPSFYSEVLKRDIATYLKTCGDKTESLAHELMKQYSDPAKEIEKTPELLLLINGENIANYAQEPLIEFGAHSHHHPNMEFLDRNTAEQELKNSKEIIENKIGKTVITFAFPDGSYLPETVKLAIDLGYENIAAVQYKHNENNSNPNLLSRFTVSNSTTYASNALRLAKQFDVYGF